MSKKINDYKTLLSKMIESRNNLQKELDRIAKEKTTEQLLNDEGYAFLLGQYTILKNFIDICVIK